MKRSIFFTVIFAALFALQSIAQTTESFFIKDDAVHTVIQPGQTPSSFLVEPVWLIGDHIDGDSLLFFLSAESRVGAYLKTSKRYAEQTVDAYTITKTELSCVTATVYTIDVQPYRLLFIAFDDRSQNALRVLRQDTGEEVAMYCDSCK